MLKGLGGDLLYALALGTDAVRVAMADAHADADDRIQALTAAKESAERDSRVSREERDASAEKLAERAGRIEAPESEIRQSTVEHIQKDEKIAQLERRLAEQPDISEIGDLLKRIMNQSFAGNSATQTERKSASASSTS